MYHDENNYQCHRYPYYNETLIKLTNSKENMYYAINGTSVNVDLLFLVKKKMFNKFILLTNCSDYSTERFVFEISETSN